MYAVRQWSVRHARGLNAFYRSFETTLTALHPLWKLIGYRRLERPVAAVERSVKGLLFDCKMCGQCVLSSTGMSCPMNCPKNLRNGPCGGVRDNGCCEVRPEMKCVWVQAVAGSERIPGGAAALSTVQVAMDRRLQGRSSWLRVAREVPGARVNFEDEPVPGYPLPILPGHTSPGRFERVLRAGQFAVTSELAPPDSADPEDVYRRARVFHGYVDAINATDGSGANCHMSSLAVCALLTRVGYAPIMQISCRDKNRIAIQGDILGGAAMGVCNILCLTGDGARKHAQQTGGLVLVVIGLWLAVRAWRRRRAPSSRIRRGAEALHAYARALKALEHRGFSRCAGGETGRRCARASPPPPIPQPRPSPSWSSCTTRHASAPPPSRRPISSASHKPSRRRRRGPKRAPPDHAFDAAADPLL